MVEQMTATQKEMERNTNARFEEVYEKMNAKLGEIKEMHVEFEKL